MTKEETNNFLKMVEEFEKMEELYPMEDLELDDQQNATLFLINKMMRKDRIFSSFLTMAVEIFVRCSCNGIEVTKCVMMDFLHFYDTIMEAFDKRGLK